MSETKQEAAGVVAEAVARLRQEAGLSAYALAGRAGVAAQLVHNMEAGADSRVSTAAKVFAALGEPGRRAWLALLDG